MSSKSEWFLKDRVTLKTGVMMLKIQLSHHSNILPFKIYSNRKQLFYIVKFHNIAILFFNQINAAFVSIRDKEKKKLIDSKLLTGSLDWGLILKILNPFEHCITRLKLRVTSEEDFEPDLVRDIKTLRSLMMTRCTSFMELRSFFFETSWKPKMTQSIFCFHTRKMHLSSFVM